MYAMSTTPALNVPCDTYKLFIRATKAGDCVGLGTAASSGDDDDLDTLPPRQLMLSNTIGRSKDSVRIIAASRRVGTFLEGGRLL